MDSAAARFPSSPGQDDYRPNIPPRPHRSRSSKKPTNEPTGCEQMEKKNDSTIIPDRKLLRLIQAARQKDTAAMMKLIELYKEDIRRVSNFIYLPTEDSISAITLEFLELILNQDE
jgi:hypothetical protein